MDVFLWFWLPVLLCVTAILALSAQPRLKAPIKFPNSDKVYHVIEYLGLGTLLARAWWATLRTPKPLVAVLVALPCGIAFGAGDELFQAMVPGRESTFTDFAADTLGVAMAQLLYFGVLRKREPRRARALLDAGHPERASTR
jgi:VanZ family protein